MLKNFKIGRHITPSGFALAYVNVPPLFAEENISLIDQSHLWEENVAALDSAVIESYVSGGGHMPRMTVTDFVVTNITTPSTNERRAAPLYYRHYCRFYHYSFGEAPRNQVYITDQRNNILRGINYLVRAERITTNVYKIEVLTDFQSNEFVVYKVRYNRCSVDGSDISPSWTETLNAVPYFSFGNPFTNVDEYSIVGPDNDGLYTAIVPPVPTISELINVVGISFNLSPTLVRQSVLNTSEYAIGVIVTYTLKATGATTFTIQRDRDRSSGAIDNYYLQNIDSDSWGPAPVNFSIGSGGITGIPGVFIYVGDDKYLHTNDEASFTASRSYYYLKPKAYHSIYLAKPRNVTPSDDWYIKVRDGRFRRRMDDDGDPAPSGYGTLFEYSVPEYTRQMWDLRHGPPYQEVINDRAEILSNRSIRVSRSPMYIEPSSVLQNENNPGFPPSSYLSVSINDDAIDPDGILDWDVYNGVITLARILSTRDDIRASYVFRQDYYDYKGFFGSGNIYPEEPPFPWEDLNINPTPGHNYGMYASGVAAHVYLRPYMNVDQQRVIASESLYHNYTGTPSGVFDFKLGTISIGPNSKLSDIEITDVRSRGGGLSKLGIENVNAVKKIQPESQFFWDIGYFDGQAIPSNGALVVELPDSILKSNGGPFEEGEVRRRVIKHMALGEYPIIRFISAA